MSEVYNPETQLYERLAELELEARQLATKRAAATNAQDREVIERQLRELEERVEILKRRLKASRHRR
jgi:hypothetical protein